MELSQAIEAENYTLAETIADSLRDLLATLRITDKQFSIKDPISNLTDCSDTLLDSLERLLRHIPQNHKKALHKIEFELFPLLQSIYAFFYFYGCVYPNPKKMQHYYEHEKGLLNVNKYIECAERCGNYKYDLSIIVTAYNKLGYTKQCIESILKTIPNNLKYELILLNTGSTDGTKEYFESLNPTKQIDIKINSTRRATGLAVYRIIEGEYIISFSNDTIATENAIENMLRCIKSDPQIGYGVPATPNVGDPLQTFSENYSTIEEMLRFAAHNNRYDPFRHEQRVFLANPVTFFKSSTFFKIGLLGNFFTNPKSPFGLSDHVRATFCRRSGYKIILAKDAYCHHYVMLTRKDDIIAINGEKEITSSRQDFFRAFGIDPLFTGERPDINLLPLIELLPFAQINILGVNTGLGSNPLKIKEQYKEEQHKLSTTVYNVTDQQNFMDDLRRVSDHVKCVKNIRCTFKMADEGFPNLFHHIIIGTPLCTFRLKQNPMAYYKCIANYKLIRNCINHLEDNGSLYVNLGVNCNTRLQKLLMRILFPRSLFNGNWVRIKK